MAVPSPRQILGALLGAISLVPLPASSQNGDKSFETQSPLPPHLKPPPSPALSPAQERKTFQLVDGFGAELVASEPLIEDPAAIDFDEHGRIWVAEMRAFMRDIASTGDNDPIGRVSILIDEDGDGAMDRSVVFADKLVLPRAIACVRGGALIAEHDKLWFMRDNDGDLVADERILVDPEYATFGSVEHRPNGLLKCVDNWIYNAKSNRRYRYSHASGEWKWETTELRGQWGISQDDFGRLYYNFNWSQLHCDLAPPNMLSRNPRFSATLAANYATTMDQRVFPIRMGTGVNRGYRPGILDERGYLKAFASACAPLVYRGDQFPPEYRGDVFVCGPGANVVKRNVVEMAGVRPAARNAWEDRDFLASTDERFRPVALSNGPDGALYIIDIYRGIIQQAEYITSHLRREIIARDLEQPIHLGRIWRIAAATNMPRKTPPDLGTADPGELVSLLGHPNGWVRDTAQRLLVEKQEVSAAPALRELLRAGSGRVATLHALWTLEGLGAEAFDDILPLVQSRDDPELLSHAWRVAREWAAENPRRVAALEKALLVGPASPDAGIEANFHGILALGSLTPNKAALDRLVDLAALTADDALYREAVVSGLAGQAPAFLERIATSESWELETVGRNLLVEMAAATAISDVDPAEAKAILGLASQARQPWQTAAMMRGLLVALEMRAVPLPLDASPGVLGRVDAPLGNRLKRHLAWPGHQPAPANEGAGSRARPLTSTEQALHHEGRRLYNANCASCHGIDGEGLQALGPPLQNSEWVLGNPEILARIVLHGLEGPVEVAGKLYGPPNILPAMPPLTMMAESEVAAILTYIRRAWNHTADPVDPDMIEKAQALTAGRETAWTVEELRRIDLPKDGR